MINFEKVVMRWEDNRTPVIGKLTGVTEGRNIQEEEGQKEEGKGGGKNSKN